MHEWQTEDIYMLLQVRLAVIYSIYQGQQLHLQFFGTVMTKVRWWWWCWNGVGGVWVTGLKQGNFTKENKETGRKEGAWLGFAHLELLKEFQTRLALIFSNKYKCLRHCWEKKKFVLLPKHNRACDNHQQPPQKAADYLHSCQHKKQQNKAG